MTKNIIIYDGHCGFCNKTILFIAKNDNDFYTFTSSLSHLGIALLSEHNINGLEKSTIILLDNNNIYTKVMP